MGKMKEHFIDKIREEEAQNRDVHADDAYWYDKWQEDLAQPLIILDVEYPFITLFKDEDGNMCIVSGKDEQDLIETAKKHGVTSDFEIIKIDRILR
jgi:phosphoglycolate phosphatase-like HAD superfamily hydrolase